MFMIMHNFKGYDSNLFIQKLTQNAEVTAYNKKIQNNIHRFLQIIDSLQSSSSSLDELVEGLGNDD